MGKPFAKGLQTFRRQQAHADGRWHRHGQLAGLLALTERDDLVIILIGDKSEQSHLRRPFFLSARALATLATLGLGRARALASGSRARGPLVFV